MNIETAVLVAIVAASAWALHRTRHLTPPDPVYDASVRVKPHRAGLYVPVAIAAIWLLVNVFIPIR